MRYRARSDAYVLECETCGAVVRVLSAAEVQKVAANPQNYLVYCRDHAPIAPRRRPWK